MRKNIVVGNWKMNKDLQEGIGLAKEVNDKLTESDVTVILCTPAIHLAEVKKAVSKSNLFIGAQNCADKESGAYTGEISAAMVKSTGAEYVILGHSERRAYYGETNAILAEKVKLALANGLTPIFCIGEVLEEREAGKHFDVVKTQLEEGLYSLSEADFKKIVLAYEPVWAIGTGKTASPDQAQEIHKVIRDSVAAKYGQAVAADCSILYGGSCKASNAPELFANPDVDGGLIGGAALHADDFLGIVTAF
ncbi:MAG: triose-phosphate isomerase [Bacteroidales bacterium]|nr:triose-phosphate isomerase [Bacteroidales bacterium]